MSDFEAKFHLQRSFFGEKERALVEFGTLRASAFRYDSGVCGIALANEFGSLLMLPFQGQQIWSARFRGRELTMKSMFGDPRRTDKYLETYGAFLVHCGAIAMGGPSAEDTHPLHGELPNAPYQTAFLVVGEDQLGDYIGVGGTYQHTVAFNFNYVAQPLVKLYAASSRFWVTMSIDNLKRSEMEFMYLAHINFRPVDGGRLLYTAQVGPESVRVRQNVPSHIHPKQGYLEWLEELTRDPERHHLFAPGLAYDPEVVFYIDYLTDESGWAHSLHIHPDGSADYVRHRPDQLPKGIRWISRTPDQDALGLVLPATAEPEGYLAEKAKGNLQIIPPEGRFHFELEIGALTPSETEAAERMVVELINDRS
jgi:hypothetical protein